MSYRIEADGFVMFNDITVYSCMKEVPRTKKVRELTYEKELSREGYDYKSGYLYFEKPVFDETVNRRVHGVHIGRIGEAKVGNCADEFGPQRFCSTCGILLEERWDSVDENVYVHPDTDCDDHEPGDVMCDTILTKDGMRIKGDVDSGIPNHKHQTMDGLKKVYKGLKGKDAKWLKENKDVLKFLYSQHADDAGESGNVAVEGAAAAWTREENRFMKFFSSNLLFRHNYVLRENRKAFEEGRIRETLYVRLRDIGNEFKGFWHPRAVRYRAAKKMSEQVREAFMDEAFMEQDFELDARRHLARVYI